MNYILERLKEPGSIRSLAVILFAAKGLIPSSWGIDLVSVDQAESVLTALILILGGYSFLKPEASTKVAEVVADAQTTTVTTLDTIKDIASKTEHASDKTVAAVNVILNKLS